MRSKVAAVLVATLAAFSFVGVAFAEHLKGTVISVDPSAMFLTIKDGWGPITFRVEQEAGKAWVSLKPGDKVTVETYSFTSGGPMEGESDWMPSAEAVTKN